VHVTSPVLVQVGQHPAYLLGELPRGESRQSSRSLTGQSRWLQAVSI
jgi:hypothetical protein